MNIGTFIDDINNVFEEVYQLELARTIDCLKGQPLRQDGSMIEWLLKHKDQRLSLLSKIDILLEDNDFRQYIINIHLNDIKTEISQRTKTFEKEPDNKPNCVVLDQCKQTLIKTFTTVEDLINPPTAMSNVKVQLELKL